MARPHKLNRRTFLKGLFVAAVTLASCVRAVYQPTKYYLTPQILKALVTSCKFDTLISTDASSFEEEWNEHYSNWRQSSSHRTRTLQLRQLHNANS